MKRILFALTLAAVLSSLARAQAPVYFADARLKAAVEEALWITDPTPSDMLGLITLNASWEGITDLTGLGYAQNLQTLHVNNNDITNISVVASLVNLCLLDVHDNRITDISVVSNLPYLNELLIRGNNIADISAVSGLTGLRTLHASMNRISNLTPLAGLVSLQSLNLEDNQVGNLSALSSLHNLGRVVLRDNQISDISPLGGVSSISFLDLHGNQISDVSALAGLTMLRGLHLSHNHISDISALAGLSNLRFLALYDNQIQDISALAGLTSLTDLNLSGNPLNPDAYAIYIPQIIANNPGLSLTYDGGSSSPTYQLSISSTKGGSVTVPGEGTFTYDQGATVLVRAQAEPDFVFSHWSGTYSTPQNPIVLTMNTDYQIQAQFTRVQDAVYVAAAAAYDPGPNDPNLSDPQEDGTSEHPFDRIQEGIDAAVDGMSILVGPGTYYENINLLGKNVQLLGIDPKDPDHAAWPVLDGGGTGPVVTFAGGEDADCLLTGFVITGGRASPAAAIACSAGSPTIANCLIAGNRAIGLNAAAVYCHDSNAVFVNCTIADNDAGKWGAGACLINSNVTFASSILWGNTATEILVDHTSQPFVSYSNVAGGWPGPGNLDTDPLFARRGYWVSAKDPNLAIEPDDPDAVWSAGDYHLRSQSGRYAPNTQTWVQDDATSACIDAGDPAAPVGDEPSPNGALLNMGVYGGTTEAGKSHLNF